jgi:PAS domain S-box-containing protein
MKAKKLLTGKNASISEMFESRIRDKSGCWHYLETTANVIDNELVLISKDVTERKKAEEALKESEERYQRLFNSSPDAIMETDSEGVVLAVNSSMVKGLGVKPEDLIGKDCKDILPKPVYEKRVAIGRKALNENKIQVDEDKRAGKYFHNIFIPIITQDGKKNLMIIARDITKRKEAEEELKESEEKYRELFNNALVGIDIHNADGSINSVNKLAENIFGLSEEELKKKDLAFWKGKLLNSNGEPMTSEEFPLAVVANSKKPSEGNVIGLRMSKNDKPRWFLHGARPILDKDGEIDKVVTSFIEITERKEAEKEIQYLKEYNENILESNPNPIIVIKGKQIEYVNKSFISIFGKTKNDYISKNLKDAVPVKIIPVFEELMQNNIKTKELEVKGKNFVANSFIVKKAEEEEEEEEERNGIIFQDITELKESKEKFKVLFDTSRDAIMTLSPPTWFFTSGNQATIDLFNAKDENEFTTKGPWNISPKHQPDGTPSDQKAKQMIQQAMEQGSKFFEWTHMTLDGKEFPATVLLTRVEIEPGKPFLQATVRDITKQKKFEEEIIETNNIINTSPIVVFLWKNEEGWPVEFASQNVKKLFGYKAEDFTKGKVPFANTIHPDDLKNVAKEVEKHSKEKTSKEFTQKYRIKTKNQKIKWIEDRTIIRRDEHGKITHYQGIIWEITDRIKLESSLKKSMKKYQDLVEGSRDGYIMTDINDHIIQYNTMFKNMTGYTDKELKDKKLKDLTPVEWHKKTIEMNKQTLKNGYSEIYEKEIIRKDGRIIPVEFRKYLVKEDGKPKAVWSYVRDITEHKKIEEEIAEKIKTLEKYKNLTVGRELRIIELKEKVKKLEEKLGERKK